MAFLLSKWPRTKWSARKPDKASQVKSLSEILTRQIPKETGDFGRFFDRVKAWLGTFHLALRKHG